MARKFVLVYFAFALFIGFSQSLIGATYTLFLASRDMNLLDMNLINFFFMISIVIFEIPTGSFADAYGRRKSVVLGCFIMAISCFMYFSFHSFWLFVLAEVLGAIGATFISGALEAWIMDTVKHYSSDYNIHSIFEREVQFSQIGAIAGVLLGSWLASFDLAWPMLGLGLAMTLNGVFALIFMKENYFREQQKRTCTDLLDISITGIKYALNHKELMYAIIFSTAYFISTQGLNMYWPFVFKNYELSVKQLGYIFIALKLSMMFGGYLSKKLRKIITDEKKLLVASQILTVAGMLFSAMLLNLNFTLFWFLAHEAGRGILQPLKQAYLNKRIESEKTRATILSFESMMSKIGAAIGLVISGYLAEHYSISASWFTSGAILALSIIIFLRNNGKSA